MEPLVERPYRSLKAFYHHGADNIGLRETAMHDLNGFHRMGSDELGTVNQRQSLLGPEGQGRHPEGAQDLIGRKDLPFVPHLPQSDQWQEKVCQGGQVSGCAHGSLGRDQRDAALVEMPQDPGKRLFAYP